MMRRTDMVRRGCSMDRRAFLKLSGLLGLGVTSSTLVPLPAEAVRFNKKAVKVSETRLAMGTFVSVTLLHPSRDRAEEAMNRAFDEMVRLERLLSRYDPSTPVAELNRAGTLRDIPPEVSEVIQRSLHFHGLTGGCFDITVKPAVDLFKERFQDGKQLPSEDQLKDVLGLIDARMVDVTEKAISLRKRGMGITLDGIAKGYIVDKAAQVLSDHHIENYLINAGGDIRTRGAKEHDRPWLVAIEDPRKKKNYPDTIRMRDGAVATSGDYEVFFDKERVFHHIVHPRTGLSPHLSTSVSVVAGTTMEADALATSVFVMNPEDGTRFIDSLPNSGSLVISREGRVLKSTAWKNGAR